MQLTPPARPAALSQATRAYCKSRYGGSRLAGLTGGKGARIAFDPVAGRGVEALADAMGDGATIFLYGALAGEPTPFPLFPAIGKNLILRGYTLFSIVGKQEGLNRGNRFVIDGLAAGRLKPVIARSFPLQDIVEAHRFLESNQQVGKIVVTV